MEEEKLDDQEVEDTPDIGEVDDEELTEEDEEKILG